MDKNLYKYIEWFNDLTDREFRIFLYSRIFRFTQDEIAQHLHIGKKKVNSTLKDLNKELKYISLKDEVLEAIFYFNDNNG